MAAPGAGALPRSEQLLNRLKRVGKDVFLFGPAGNHGEITDEQLAFAERKGASFVSADPLTPSNNKDRHLRCTSPTEGHLAKGVAQHVQRGNGGSRNFSADKLRAGQCLQTFLVALEVQPGKEVL